jgi:ribosome-binding protein aMBF1 (putative translation factor)
MSKNEENPSSTSRSEETGGAEPGPGGLDLDEDDEKPRRERRLQAFGAAVRRRRQDLGLSQETLAEGAGVHRTYVGGIERGERNVSLINILGLAEALELSSHELMERYEAELRLIEEFSE